ncbi:MAG: hypothetical protein LAO51_14185 [Acidobacteriia bacterium]|nr:hypothetical protein [Terriglobia bacterium]
MARSQRDSGVSPRPEGSGVAPRLDRVGELLGPLAPLATVALAAVFAFRRLDDFDTWWHLAAGRWIVQHRAVPSTDTLSHTVRDHPWINLEWAYEVLLYLLHAAGGPVLLCLAAAVTCSLAVWLLLRLVRAELGDVGGAWIVLAALLVIEDRFVIRPEMVSFPLLLGLLTILDLGRRREGRGLWLLVPLMVVWVNVHGLFVIGVFAILCALASAVGSRIPALPASVREGSRWDAASFRKLAIWGSAAMAAVVVNPFGLAGALLPVKLYTLIDKSSPALQSIGEFRSPFAVDVGGVSIAAYKGLLAVGAASILVALVKGLRRGPTEGATGVEGVDLGSIAFFAGLAALSVVARRNAALFALGGTPCIARSLGSIVRSLPARARDRLRGFTPLAAWAAVVGAIVLGALVVTGTFYRWDGQCREFGGGILEGTFPVRAAAFAREARLPPKLYNDVAAGGYLAWDDPIGEGVFIDGRLEVYDSRFFHDYVAAMYDQAKWEAEADRLGIETVILFHRWENRRLLVERLFRGGKWSLVYADEVAAVFVRAKGNEQAIARAVSLSDRYNRATRAWLERPIPKIHFPGGRIEGTRSFARLLATIGDGDGAAEQYSRLFELGIPEPEEIETRLLMAKYFSESGRADRAKKELERILTMDPGNREAQERLRAR